MENIWDVINTTIKAISSICVAIITIKGGNKKNEADIKTTSQKEEKSGDPKK